MPRTSTLEQTIEKAAADFALQVVAAIKASSLQELMALQATGAPAKPGRKAKAAKPGRKPGRPAGKPGRKPKAAKAAKAPKEAAAEQPRKKRVVKNYPKCAFPGCDKNRFVRGKGFCGEHFKQFQEGKIGDAASYK